MNMPSDSVILEALTEAIRSGRRVAVPVAGTSMGEPFRRADAVVIQSAAAVRLFPGMIVVFQRDNRWIAHRAVWVYGRSSEYLCITKGDRIPALDRPFVRKEEGVGVVVEIRLGSRVWDLTSPASRVAGIWKVVIGLAKIPIFRLLRGRGLSGTSSRRGDPG